MRMGALDVRQTENAHYHTYRLCITEKCHHSAHLNPDLLRLRLVRQSQTPLGLLSLKDVPQARAVSVSLLSGD